MQLASDWSWQMYCFRRLNLLMLKWWERFWVTKPHLVQLSHWNPDGGSSINQSPWQSLFPRALTVMDQVQSTVGRPPLYVCFVVLQVGTECKYIYTVYILYTYWLPVHLCFLFFKLQGLLFLDSSNGYLKLFKCVSYCFCWYHFCMC